MIKPVYRCFKDIETQAKPKLWTLSDAAISTRMGSYNYSIELVRIQTKRDVLMWVSHLASKTWMTKEGLKQFADIMLGVLPR